MDYDKYMYIKHIIHTGDNIYFAWYVVDIEKRYGVHLHGHEQKGKFRTLGVEFHSPVPQYDGHEPVCNWNTKVPDDCWVTKGICYHDGSSLMAETFDFVQPYNPEHDERVFLGLQNMHEQNKWK